MKTILTVVLMLAVGVVLALSGPANAKPVKTEHMLLTVSGIKNKSCTVCPNYNGAWHARPTGNTRDGVDGVDITGDQYMTTKVDACGALNKQFDIIIEGGKTKVRILHDVKTAATWTDGVLVQEAGVCDLSGATVTVTGPFAGW